MIDFARLLSNTDKVKPFLKTYFERIIKIEVGDLSLTFEKVRPVSQFTAKNLA